MRRPGYLLIVFSVIIATSCQRELDPGPANNPPGSGDSILLRMYVEIDTTLPAGLDTTYKIVYTYDDRKRVSAYYIESDDFFENGVNHYLGNDTLPHKRTVEWSELVESYRDTTYLQYENGLVKYDSIIERNASSGLVIQRTATSYSQSGNNTFVQTRDYLTVPATGASGMVFKTYINGNIATQEDTSLVQVVPDRKYYQITYDNHVNPFYRAELPYPVLNKFNIQKNNVLTYQAGTNSSTIELEYDAVYTYRPDGYPLIARIYYFGSLVADKCMFFYTN